ncbi:MULTISPECIES: hypothetical protein [Bacillus]|uniref:Uncharacterized protein n=10 Tax=Bacillus thuringiensis TaxID=1428 RepID=A0A9W4EXJ9_BACTO|nr:MULTISPECIES: hypothetical protein [Bacillus]MEB8714502.1 hypothetical protein [Bacillus cereus]AEA19219.1 hypothetical protein CT43_P127037 [Bacillus thuringiensis serovar chinensis CT-43]AGG04748.1 hypothetical protein H175_107p024 [Bacillus thuringiensis serovar thuringiensis str. IS5056]ERH96991.1 hypothetical protein BTCBT_006878 [Bacillus thuringiensis T01-328]MCD9104298.1 hypothetical protein [Bacillus sp. PLB03]
MEKIYIDSTLINTKKRSGHIGKKIINGCVEIQISSERDTIFNNILSIQKELGLNTHNQVEAIKISGLINYIQDEITSVTFDSDNRCLSVKGPLELFVEGRALYFLSEYMSECLQASYTNSLLIHAAAVYSKEKDRSYLILGEKGSGKTTLSFRLCQELGLSLIGNDLVRIGYDENGELFTKEGSRWFDVRETAVKADDYMNKLATILSAKSANSWNNKTRILPEDHSIETHFEQSKIDKILNIRIDPYQNYFSVSPWEGVQRNLILHEKIGRHISGQATPFQDDQGNYLGSLPSINRDKASLVRDNIVKCMVNTGITELFGPDSKALATWFKEEVL